MILTPAIHVQMRGAYMLMVRRNGLPFAQSRWIPNLILNQGRDYLGTMSGLAAATFPRGPFGYCHVGEGSVPPDVTQTALQSFSASVIANTAGAFFTDGAPTHKSSVYQFYPFAQGALVGTFRELGISRTLATGSLFSRTLITDPQGAPTPLTLVAADQLTVAYALEFTPQLTPFNGTVDLQGIKTYSANMMYLTNLGNSSGSVGLPNPSINQPFMGVSWANGLVQGTCYGAGTPLSPTVNTDQGAPGATSTVDVLGPATKNTIYNYTPGTYGAQCLFGIPGPAGNAVGGIQSVAVRLALTSIDISMRVLYYFNQVVPKTTQKQLTLDIRSSWGP